MNDELLSERSLDGSEFKDNDIKVDDIKDNSSEYNILYITLGLILLVFFLWFIASFFTGEDEVEMLKLINDASLQIHPSSDKNNIHSLI